MNSPFATMDNVFATMEEAERFAQIVRGNGLFARMHIVTELFAAEPRVAFVIYAETTEQ